MKRLRGASYSKIDNSCDSLMDGSAENGVNYPYERELQLKGANASETEGFILGNH